MPDAELVGVVGVLALTGVFVLGWVLGRLRASEAVEDWLGDHGCCRCRDKAGLPRGDDGDWAAG
jgi:hypothetical protein